MTEPSPLAREAAINAWNTYPVKATSQVSYRSAGRVIVIGNATALEACGHWTTPGQVALLCSDSGAGGLPDGAIAAPRESIRVSGYLGAFDVELVEPGRPPRHLEADILVDFSREALFPAEIPPPGYLHRDIDTDKPEEVEQEVSDLVGEFEKPKFFHYDASKCAHSVNGVTVCSRCIDACPAEAIEDAGDAIAVIPFLCQGGGSCATVCPSGAIQYAYPGLSDSGNRLRVMLEAYRQAGGSRPVILFHAESRPVEELVSRSERLLPAPVEELASVGMELCLSALAYGAERVILLDDDEVPALSRQSLRRQLEWLQGLLAAMGMTGSPVIMQGESVALPLEAPAVAVEAAVQDMPGDKRKAFFQAIDHLVSRIGQGDAVIDLPPGAPFGSVVIDENKCTLCLACIGACPGRALQDGSNREAPEVFFIESHCIQCGACTQTCPEQAMTLVPRLVLDRESRNRSRVLHRDEPFGCIQCGKPFAPTSAIEKMVSRLEDHPMFRKPGALDRLKMCEDCRVVDIVQDRDAMNGNFDPSA